MKVDIRRAYNIVVFNLFFCLSLLLSFAIFSPLADIIFNAISFIKKLDSLFSLFLSDWIPSDNKFGILPVVLGTFYVSLLTMCISVPLGILIAFYMSIYMKSRPRRILKTILESFSGTPTIIIGFVVAFFLAAKFMQFANLFSANISLENAITPAMGISLLLTPYIAVMIEEVFTGSSEGLIQSGLALGLTKYEVAFKILLQSNRYVIFSIVMIAFSRAIGETMIVVIACGIGAFFSFSLLAPSTTITVQIVHLLTGDLSFDSVQILSAFFLSFLLFILVFAINIIGLVIKGSK